MKRAIPNIGAIPASNDPSVNALRLAVHELRDFLSELAGEQGGLPVSKLKPQTIDWQAIKTSSINLDAVGGSGYLKANGTVPLSADWNAGGYQISASVFKGRFIGTASGNLSSTSPLYARNLTGAIPDAVSIGHKFIVQGTSDASLTAAQFLGALGTGALKNTTTTGVLSICSSQADYPGLTTSSNVTFNSVTVSGLTPGRIVFSTTAGLLNDDTNLQYSSVTKKITTGGYLLLDGSDKNYGLSVYAAGTAYSLTITSALLTFGTTSPTLTLDKAGTYLIRARAQVVRNNSTHVAGHTVTLKLRRTNNTAADLTNAVTAYPDDPHNAANDTEGNWMVPEVIYTTANTDDVIELWGDVSSAGTGGTHDVIEASIVAVRIY